MIKKHKYLILLIAILFLNIIFAKYIVHQFYYQNYVNTLLFVGLNIVLFPVAIFVYKKEQKRKGVDRNDE